MMEFQVPGPGIGETKKLRQGTCLAWSGPLPHYSIADQMGSTWALVDDGRHPVT